mmetsp:Transcript_8141/g.14111  ORF Transcript_8141/g.14111 Transcript_8141/m.14111 type:complete len:219 (+) Transcript_8141:1402-2058(+)
MQRLEVAEVTRDDCEAGHCEVPLLRHRLRRVPGRSALRDLLLKVRLSFGDELLQPLHVLLMHLADLGLHHFDQRLVLRVDPVQFRNVGLLQLKKKRVKLQDGFIPRAYLIDVKLQAPVQTLKSRLVVLQLQGHELVGRMSESAGDDNRLALARRGRLRWRHGLLASLHIGQHGERLRPRKIFALRQVPDSLDVKKLCESLLDFRSDTLQNADGRVRDR